MQEALFAEAQSFVPPIRLHFANSESIADELQSLGHALRDTLESFEPHHYAFHLGEDEFDAIFQRVQEADIPWGSDPRSTTNRQLNSRKGGRGVYFHDPDGHLLELLTRA